MQRARYLSNGDGRDAAHGEQVAYLTDGALPGT